jgi:hypothetical protein
VMFQPDDVCMLLFDDVSNLVLGPKLMSSATRKTVNCGCDNITIMSNANAQITSAHEPHLLSCNAEFVM